MNKLVRFGFAIMLVAISSTVFAQDESATPTPETADSQASASDAIVAEPVIEQKPEDPIPAIEAPEVAAPGRPSVLEAAPAEAAEPMPQEASPMPGQTPSIMPNPMVIAAPIASNGCGCSPCRCQCAPRTICQPVCVDPCSERYRGSRRRSLGGRLGGRLRNRACCN